MLDVLDFIYALCLLDEIFKSVADIFVIIHDQCLISINFSKIDIIKW